MEEKEEEEEAVTVDALLGAGKVPGRGRRQAGLEARREAQGPERGAQPGSGVGTVPVPGSPLPPRVPLLLLARSRSVLRLGSAGKHRPACPALPRAQPLSLISSPRDDI